MDLNRHSWDRRLVVGFVVALLASLAMWFLERRDGVGTLIHGWRATGQAEEFWRLWTYLAQGVGLVGLVVAAIVYEHDHRRRQLALVAALLGGAFCGILKLLIDRTRPDGGELSWPSGHATTAFAFAFALSWGRLRTRWWLLGLAALVAASRVVIERHWPSDVVAGVAIAFAGLLLAARLHVRRLPIPDHGTAAGLLGLAVAAAGLSTLLSGTPERVCSGWGVLIGLVIFLRCLAPRGRREGDAA